MGRIGSGVWVSVSFQGSVLRQQKKGGLTKGEGSLTSLRLRRITSSTSQTLCHPLVLTTDDRRRGECSMLAAVRHGECSMLAAVCRGCYFHTSRLLRLTTV